MRATAFNFRRLCPVLLALVWSLGVAQVQQTEQVSGPLAGIWQGSIETPGAPLDVTVELQQEGQEWHGTIDIPAQGAEDLPLERISVEDEVVSFTISGVPGTPTFQGTVAESEITGLFTQAGQEFPFTLNRAEEESAPLVGPSEQGEFEDPRGRFTFPVPTGWAVAEQDGYIRVSGPEEGLNVYVVVSRGSDLEAAIDDGWKLVQPGFDLEPSQTLTPPSEPGVERTVVANYEPADDEQVYQAVAQLHDGTIYTMLFDAELAALQRRSAQLQIVASGFEIAGVEGVDLAGAEVGTVEGALPELEEFIGSSLDAFGIPGVAVSIVQDGEVVYAKGFGVREAGGSEPITPETHMMIGSTGKTMTSMVMATLVDDGLVEWDTPVIEVLPQFAVADPQITEQFTVRHLLCACTGVPRRDFELFFNADTLSAEDIVASLESFEVFTAFGEAFQYSNQLVATAGYVAAAAAGAEFGELYEGYVESLNERVLDPIDMDNTTLSFEQVRERGEHAMPHQQNIESGEFEPIPLELERFVVPVAPAGGHWSTAEDMARYLITELNVGVAPDGERVVSEENIRETWVPQVPLSADESYGLGWFVGEYKGLDWIHHGGNTLGFTSEFVFVPEANVGIVVLTNAGGSNAFNQAVAERLFELLYDQPSEVQPQVEFLVSQTETALAEARTQVEDAVEPQEVEPFLGQYTNAALGEITLELEAGQLFIDSGEFRAEIRPALDRQGEFDSYVTYGPPVAGLPIALEENDDGEQTVVLGQGAIEYTFERVE